jgi:DNA-binding NtrC family response regulator
MNGLELYDHFQMREELKAIPALLMSAHAPLREMKKRNIYFVKKPFELEELLETIEKLLSE